MAPKKVSGGSLTAGEEPLTAVILADSFTQVACAPLHLDCPGQQNFLRPWSLLAPEAQDAMHHAWHAGLIEDIMEAIRMFYQAALQLQPAYESCKYGLTRGGDDGRSASPPMSLEKPKVLLPLIGVPMISYTLEWLASKKVSKVGPDSPLQPEL